MAKIVKASGLREALSDALAANKALTKSDMNKAVRVTAIKIWGDIIKLTPVDSGRARGNWFIGMSVTPEVGSANERKGTAYVVDALPKDVISNKVFLYNNLPYIEKLEFGGYGNEDTEKTNTRGFSKLAPKGMVRVSLLKWGPTLQKVFKAV